MSVKRITLNSIFLSLLIISAFISIPVSEISFTLQVLVVVIISLLLKPVDAILVIGLYFIMGLLGIPVFSQGGGPAYLLKPSFGYLLGFLFVPLIRLLFLKLKIKYNFVKDILTSVIGLFIIYLFGSIYFIFIMKNVNGIDYNMSKVLAICVIPFIPFDIAKLVAANLIVPALRKATKLNVEEEVIQETKNRRTLINRPSTKLINKYRGK